jgi:lysophospholipase
MTNTSSQTIRRSYPTGSIVGDVPASDGWPLRTFNWPVEGGAARGSILFQTGRGDMFEKYLETFALWHDAGWDVTAFDWRGQGGSGRLSANAKVGHVDDFSVWVDDLADFWENWSAANPGPHVLMGHSMGGHVVMRACVEGRINPAAVVLIAPMLGLNAPPLSPRLAASMAHILAKIMPSTMPAWPGNEKPSLPFSSRQKYLTWDDERYSDEIWWRGQKPELLLGPPTWQWLSAAYKSCDAIQDGPLESVHCPILILATSGDKLVATQPIKDIKERLPNVDLVMFGKTVAHEILRERDGPREHALRKIAAVLDAVTAEADTAK